MKTQRGSVVAEFIVVFPAFLVLCLFVVEVSLMWADKHVMRLAAFEAARALAAKELPYLDGDGNWQDDPCNAPGPVSEARGAAVRKMAIITMPYSLFVAKLKTNLIPTGALPSISMPEVSGNARALSRLIQRWPTAVATTTVACAYDPRNGSIHVAVTYDRVPQTPIIDHVMWMLYRLSLLANGTTEMDLDSNFFLVKTRVPALDGLGELRANVQGALSAASTLGMNASQTANFLGGVPGMDAVFGQLPAVPQGTAAFFGGAASQVQAGITTVTAAQSTILTAVLLAVPEALRTIPMTTRVQISRKYYSENAQVEPDGATITEPAWSGRVTGAMDFTGDLRTWGQELSKPSEYIRREEAE